MVFDPTRGWLPSFKGACTRGIYDNMKTAVETAFIGKGPTVNRRPSGGPGQKDANSLILVPL
jgi:hypothetical protein